MKPKLLAAIIFLFALSFCKAQDTTIVLNTSLFDPYLQTINLTKLDGWIYKQGNDLNWKAAHIETIGWEKIKPTQLSAKNADKNGKLEGWLRLRFTLDGSFVNMPLGIQTTRWAATDIYLDGNYVDSYGNTGINAKPFRENSNTFAKTQQLQIETGVEHVLAVHIVDYIAPLNQNFLKSGTFGSDYGVLVLITNSSSSETATANIRDSNAFGFLFSGVIGFLSLLFWFLYLQNKIDKNLLLISISSSVFFLWQLFIALSVYPLNIGFDQWWLLFFIGYQAWPVATAMMIITVGAIFNVKYKKALLIFGILFVSSSLVTNFIIINPVFFPLHPISAVLVQVYILLSSWKKLKGAQWAVVAGVILTTLFSVIWSSLYIYYQKTEFPNNYIFQSLQCLSYPASLMIYITMRFKEIMNEVRVNADKVIKITEEKKELLANQNLLLEQQVEERTRELKASQAQLIQSEKMASLGELTAGIAHEIQNPLNFVNNFSDVNTELIDELKSDLAVGHLQSVNEIADTIKENEQKINHHGKRADSIVKGMLQHSQKSTGEKTATDINALADEYLRLSYHGLRAKNKEFNATMKTDFDNSIGKINIIPQDIGRALLNLYNNAFYAVNEKSKQVNTGYEPTVSVSTKKINDKVEIKVNDNGNGIQQSIIDKIFQPFFTTKPTGQGTGLGLSLAYDIVKAHGGDISAGSGGKAESEGSEFVINLPILSI